MITFPSKTTSRLNTPRIIRHPKTTSLTGNLDDHISFKNDFTNWNPRGRSDSKATLPTEISVDDFLTDKVTKFYPGDKKNWNIKVTGIAMINKAPTLMSNYLEKTEIQKFIGWPRYFHRFWSNEIYFST